MRARDQLLAAVGRLPADLVRYEPGWDSLRISGRLRLGLFRPRGVVLHHTAGVNSLHWLASGGDHPPVPGANALISRDGVVHVLSCRQTYHGGEGSISWVPGRNINPYSWGIEVESLGRVRDFTSAQIKSIGLLTSGLLAAGGLGVDRLIDHEVWRPSKVDTLYSLSEIRGWARAGRAAWEAQNAPKPKPEPKPAPVTNPAAKPAPKPASKPKPAKVYHVVRWGETLGGIATKNGTTVTKLCALNGITNPDRVRAGRRIRVR